MELAEKPSWGQAAYSSHVEFSQILFPQVLLPQPFNLLVQGHEQDIVSQGAQRRVFPKVTQ